MANLGVPEPHQHESAQGNKPNKGNRRRRRFFVLLGLAIVTALTVAAGAMLVVKASGIRAELTSASALIPSLKQAVSADDTGDAVEIAQKIAVHTGSARTQVEDPIWTLASAVPGVGRNFSAVSEIARAADDVSQLGLTPLVGVFHNLDWESVLPSQSGSDLKKLHEVSPTVTSAAYAVRKSADRLSLIETDGLLQEVVAPLVSARAQLQEVTGVLDAAADGAQLMPAMMGVDAPKTYLLMIQNNAETRASGGIPGALAVLNLDRGKLTLGSQASALDLGVMSPPVTLEPQQQQIYTTRLGKYMQDVNLTPDFPSAAKVAAQMWDRHTGKAIDGVISVDPVALGYILKATGPVKIGNPDVLALADGKLPSELNGDNVVPTLLSDVYAQIEQPELQDVYFSGVAKEIFAALSIGQGSPEKLLEGVSTAVGEGRILVWSASDTEQALLSKYAISGSISGPSIAPAQFGVYFNDGTGAKMDYYVRRTVQLDKECPADGYEQVKVRVTSTNTAPPNAAHSLPSYVTGGGSYGVPPGTVQSNIIAYGPTQAQIESAAIDGEKTGFASYLHSSRPVGVLAQRLSPGESSTVEFTFSKIVQHTEPKVTVTPTVHPVQDVVLSTTSTTCD